MRHIISALFLCFSTAGALAQDAKPIELAPDAPDHHVVVRGDTLWGISKLFLKDPFRWPEVWQLNSEQIKNPHRIYPGQVVYLDTTGGEPRLRLGKVVGGGGEGKLEPRVYSEDQKREIPAIPQQIIEPFLTEPLVVEQDTLQTSPRIVATEDGHVAAGAGSKVYATGIDDSSVKSWHIYRPGPPLKDPDTKEVLGQEAIYVGTASFVAAGKPANDSEMTPKHTKTPGETELNDIQHGPKHVVGAAEASTLELTSTKMEVAKGDSLMPAARPEIMSYVPHAPTTQIKGKIVGIYGGVGEAGRYSIVSLSKGRWDGVEVGHVLAIYRTGEIATNRLDKTYAEAVKLPDERYGLLFVFRVFDRVSYALIMETSRSVVTGDIVQTP